MLERIPVSRYGQQVYVSTSYDKSCRLHRLLATAFLQRNRSTQLRPLPLLLLSLAFCILRPLLSLLDRRRCLFGRSNECFFPLGPFLVGDGVLLSEGSQGSRISIGERCKKQNDAPLPASASWRELPFPLASRSTLLMRVACPTVEGDISNPYKATQPSNSTHLAGLLRRREWRVHLLLRLEFLLSTCVPGGRANGDLVRSCQTVGIRVAAAVVPVLLGGLFCGRQVSLLEFWNSQAEV